MFRAPANIDHKHIRIFDHGGLVATAADGGFGFFFKLNDLPNHTDFTSLYDMYRIDLIEAIWELTPLVPAALVTKTSNIMPVILAWSDQDDATPPTTLAAVNNIARVERLELSEANPAIKRSFRPHVQLGAFGSGTNNAGAVQPAGFIDCGLDAVNHYGVKFWIKNFNTTTVSNTGAGIQVSFRYHLTLRNPL
jgi:hypothetical protein